jgi:hypothetical protein
MQKHVDTENQNPKWWQPSSSLIPEFFKYRNQMHCYCAACFWISKPRTFQARSRRASHDEGTATSLIRFWLGRLVYVAVRGGETSHMPTHGQISAPSSQRQSDGRRRNAVAFKRNLRGIIFASRPLPPSLHLLFRRQLMKLHLSLTVVYKAALNISGTNPAHADLHTDVPHTITYHKEQTFTPNIKQRSNFITQTFPLKQHSTYDMPKLYKN